jgi:signal transduction histidine kinase
MERSNLQHETIGALLALVAHDLRNPLSALQSNLGFLKGILPPERDAVEATDDGLVSVDALAHVIDNLELLGRVLGNRTEGAPTRVELVAVARGVVARARNMAVSHGSTVGLEADASGVVVRGRPELVTRAVSNLVYNGIQYSAARGGVRVTVAAERGAGVLRVFDAGPKIPERLQIAAFSASGQVECKGELAARYGRGLGLFCASAAAQLDGGRLGVGAVEGESCFELRLPLEPD